jgi:hypothetical protein
LGVELPLRGFIPDKSVLNKHSEQELKIESQVTLTRVTYESVDGEQFYWYPNKDKLCPQ